jgi:hypothetical protein
LAPFIIMSTMICRVGDDIVLRVCLFTSSSAGTTSKFALPQTTIWLPMQIGYGKRQRSTTYVWSSYRSNAFGQIARMWSPHKEYVALGNNSNRRQLAYQQLFLNKTGSELITDIRHALNTGLVLGNDRFRAEVEQLTGQHQKHLKRGPKKVTANC